MLVPGLFLSEVSTLRSARWELSSTAAILAACALAACAKPAEPSREQAPPVPNAAPAAAPSEGTRALSPVPVPALTRPSQPLNVLLLTVDSMRWDMPWAGYPRQIAPRLSELAARSTVYENHRSLASYTAQTVATLLSGQYASSLYRDGWFFTGYHGANTFFTEVLQARGISTLGLHAHMYFGKDKGLNQGFDVWETVPGISFDAQTDKHVTSEKSATRLIELLGEPRFADKPFFAWAHFMDPHDQYIAHAESPDFGKKNRDRYDSEVFYTDLWIGKVLDFVASRPFGARTAILVTGDHGETFGEHGMYKHAFELWDVLLRVPLLIHVPGAAPRRIAAGRTHIDLAPTILDLMGVPALEQFAGQSLVPEVFGKAAEERQPILLELAEDSHNPGLVALVEGDYKLIMPRAGGGVRLFNLKRDPDELENLVQREPEKVRELVSLLEGSFQKIPRIEPYGGMKLKSGRRARGPEGPAAK